MVRLLFTLLNLEVVRWPISPYRVAGKTFQALVCPYEWSWGPSRGTGNGIGDLIDALKHSAHVLVTQLQFGDSASVSAGIKYSDLVPLTE